MGNIQQNSSSNQQTKVVLQLRMQDIIIHDSFKMNLKLADVQIFPHGLDGLRLWEAGIILARYAILNCSMFKDKQVLQLGSGVGIAGITVKKWTVCKSIQMTDYHPQVVEIIKSNCLKNNQKIQSFVFDWRKRDTLTKTYDLIIGSDIVYFGCPVHDLYMVCQEKLNDGGKVIIVIPDRKNYAELFLKQINPDKFDHEFEQLNNQAYLDSPLQSQQKAKYQFSLLWETKFKALILTKRSKKQNK